MNVTECPLGWTRQSELSKLSECDVPILGVTILKLSVPVLAAFIFFIECILFSCRFSSIMKKGKSTIILVCWVILQNLVMSLRPIIGVTMGIVPASSLWFAFVTHISTIFAAGIVVLFIYIQIKILAKSALGKTNWLYSNKKIILGLMGSTHSALFLIGPLISNFTGISLHIMFWSTVIAIVFTLIPYFFASGVILYHKIMHIRRDDNKAIARRLLVTIILCSGLSLFTGAVGLYSIFVNTYEWALIELCWIADLVFNAIFFLLFSRTKKH